VPAGGDAVVVVTGRPADVPPEVPVRVDGDPADRELTAPDGSPDTDVEVAEPSTGGPEGVFGALADGPPVPTVTVAPTSGTGPPGPPAETTAKMMAAAAAEPSTGHSTVRPGTPWDGVRSRTSASPGAFKRELTSWRIRSLSGS
jgi:hypothetical protein